MGSFFVVEAGFVDRLVPIGSVQPPYLAAVLPFALLFDALLADVGSNAMLLASLPRTNVFAAISPHESSMAFTLVIDELSTVHLAILPF